MAEYYPLLAKAVGSLPNSTPESRRVVYERARKALIGQLRTLHPPIPDDDIESESVALDRAIERLESELANGSVPVAPGAPSAAVTTDKPRAPDTPKPVPTARPSKPPVPPVAKPLPAPAVPVPARVPVDVRPGPPLRPKVAPKPPVPRPPSLKAPNSVADSVPPPPALPPQIETVPQPVDAEPLRFDEPKRLKPPRSDPQRPIAPQPPDAKGPRRRLWIIPATLGVVIAVVGFAAYKLRDHPETIARKPAEQTQTDTGKIAERVGGPTPSATSTPSEPAPQAQDQPASTPAPATTNSPPQTTPAPNNPELPVAHRAALLVEAPDEPNKVKTFLGTVVWKLNNVPQGPNDAVGLAVEADIDLPDDKMKAVVTFAKNTEASLPASHTINVRYSVEGGSFTGDVKQISVPQMRPESSPSGEPLAGVTVQIVPNSFLVGLSPGNAETANTDLIRRLQWIDIPMLLDNGKIAKLTFEKSDSGQRDLNEALDAWEKQ